MNHIQKERLKKVISPLITKMYFAYTDSGRDIYKNGLDVCKALLEQTFCNISFKEWERSEQIRLRGKTLENSIGELNEQILSCFDGFLQLEKGNVFDLVNHQKKIIVELKNKHNSTKGSSKVKIYDDFKMGLHSEYINYTGYYIELIPKSRNPYDECFIPSDNTKKSQRPKREDIRRIDGHSFYKKIVGLENGILEVLEALFEIIPEIIFESSPLHMKSEPPKFSDFESNLKMMYGAKLDLW